MIAGRFVTGMACGATTVVVPMYLGEISPPELRGALGTSFQFTICISMCAAQVLGMGEFLGTPDGWPFGESRLLLLLLLLLLLMMMMMLLPITVSLPPSFSVLLRHHQQRCSGVAWFLPSRVTYVDGG